MSASPTQTPRPSPRPATPESPSARRAQAAASFNAAAAKASAQTPISTQQKLAPLFSRIRSALNKNSQWTAIGVCLFAIVCVLLALRSTSKPDRVLDVHAWYYDLNTQTLFVDRYHETMSPIETASGKTSDGRPAGCRAVVFACGSCEVEADRFVAYLIRPADDGNGNVITTPTGTKWMPTTSVEAETLLANLSARCHDKPRISPDECPAHP